MSLFSEEKLHTNQKLVAQWTTLTHCPSCGSPSSKSHGELPLDYYYFSENKIDIERNDILILECNKCRLLYKNKIPSQGFISQLINNQSNKIWSYKYDYEDEINLINSLLSKKNSYDLLDIGAANGDILKLTTKFGGRRSALDIALYPGLKIRDNGEFIQGFLDDPNLIWSQQQYDVVTLFDVLEHLYDPSIAFYNLKKLVKKEGFLIIETGDSAKYWYKHNKINCWQYIGLFEHHMIWNKFSILFQAQKYGFDIISYENKKNKYYEKISIKRQLGNLAKLCLYSASERAYRLLSKALRKYGMQPTNLFVKDHCRVILKNLG